MISVETLLAKDAIVDCAARYCHGIDRMDESWLTSAFWPDASIDYGMFKGKAVAFVPAVLKSLSERMERTMHFLGNMIIRVEGSTAKAEIYVIAHHRVKAVPQAYDLVTGNRYLDLYERRNSEWRISRRRVVSDWFRQANDAADLAKGYLDTKSCWGERNPADPVYDLFDERDVFPAAGLPLGESPVKTA